MSINAENFRVIINQKANTAEMFIYDTIGPDWAGLISAKGVIDQLKAMGDVAAIDVRINSQGGSVFEGLGIYNALKNHPAKVTVHIDGIALSAASFIAMAGDTINIAENGMMMIHAPYAEMRGSARDLRKQAKLLDQLTAQMVGIYAARTGLTDTEITSLVNKETWFQASEAKAKGFATNITPNKAISASADLSQFKNVPDWGRAVLASAPPIEKDPPMPEPVVPVVPVTPEPVAVVPPVLPVSPPVDTVAIQNAATIAERNRVRDITAICTRAGHPQAAAKFIDENLTTADVSAKMFDQMCIDRVPVGDSVPPTEKPVDPDAKYKAEWQANKIVNEQMGVSEAQYVLSRKKTAAQ